MGRKEWRGKVVEAVIYRVEMLNKQSIHDLAIPGETLMDGISSKHDNKKITRKLQMYAIPRYLLLSLQASCKSQSPIHKGRLLVIRSVYTTTLNCDHVSDACVLDTCRILHTSLIQRCGDSTFIPRLRLKHVTPFFCGLGECLR